LTQRISAPDVLMQISILEESVHDAQCVVTAQLQLEPAAIIYVSIRMFTYRTVPNSRGFITFRKALLVSSTNSRLCAF